MAEDKQRKIIQSKGSVFNDLTMRVKLILRLLGDSRVNPLIKLLPIGSVVYLIFPDIAPGPIDDAAIIWLGTYLFVELCPPNVVQEHMSAINQVVSGQWHDPLAGKSEEEIVDGEYREDNSGNNP